MSTSMPIKLKILAGILIGATLLNVLDGHWFWAVYGAALSFVVLKGNDRARLIVFGLTLLNLVVIGVFLLVRFTGTVVWFMMEASLVAFSLFVFWCMRAPDVREWMSKPRTVNFDV